MMVLYAGSPVSRSATTAYLGIWSMGSMQASSARDLRLALAPYLSRSTPIAVALFLANIAVYLAAVAGAVALDAWPAQLACAIVAGSAISALFVIGHDA